MREKTIVPAQLTETLDSIQNAPLRLFLKFLFAPDNLGGKFMESPGATTGNHHSYPGGLAYHTVHAAKLGAKIADHYLSLGFQVDKDVVVAGIMLHDLGKIMAYEVKGQDEKGVYQIDKTPHERLYHHIPTGTLLLHEAILNYNHSPMANDTGQYVSVGLRDKLMHIILSHHGRKAWSSPVIPQFLEAYIVHIVEFMDGMIEKYADGKVPTNIYDH